MELAELLPKEHLTKEQQRIDVTGLALDSQKVVQGDLFCAFAGRKADGRRYIGDALARGAVAVVVESGIPHQWIPEQSDIPIIEMSGLSRMIGGIASQFYGHPSKSQVLVGVTGTNGKTSCSFFISQALQSLGYASAVMGTLGVGRVENLPGNAVNTTPDPISMQMHLSQWLVQNGGEHAQHKLQPAMVMEVSSHGIEQERIRGCQFTTAVFTNLSQDHLDYHGNMQRYADVKKRLFKMPGLQNAVVNVDDPVGVELVQELLALETGPSIIAYGRAPLEGDLKSVCDRVAHHVSVKKQCLDHKGVSLEVSVNGASLVIKDLPLWGEFNISNVLATISALVSLGVSVEQISEAVLTIMPPPGRMHKLVSQERDVFIDYAHTPDAVTQAITAIKAHFTGDRPVYALLGCGGDRDVGKRALMGRSITDLADHVVITTDNPRSEAPHAICEAVQHGARESERYSNERVQMITSRREAIWRIIATAPADAIIVLLGRGHESYQAFGQINVPFSDEAVAEQALTQAVLHNQLGANEVEATRYLLRLNAVASIVEGEFNGVDAIIRGVSTDTRTLTAGDLYVPLVGENFNGHDFIASAFQNGAVACLVAQAHIDQLQFDAGQNVIVVADTLKALGKLARAHKAALSVPTVGLTGSCGKTSVKEMIGSIFSQQGKTLATKGNLNNEIGVPLTLLNLSAEHEYAVIEMGANHAGDIAYTVGLSQPNVALITNAAEAHLEGFGSIDGVAKAKSEIYTGLVDGFAIINLDDPHAEFWLERTQQYQQITFSSDMARVGARTVADFQLMSVEPCGKGDRLSVNTPRGIIKFTMPLPGQHQWANAVVAIAATQLIGITTENMVSGLEALQPVPGRLRPVELPNAELALYDDTYNANPHSVRAAINFLASRPGKTLMIIGNMAELGEGVVQEHHDVGAYIAAKQAIAGVVAIGQNAAALIDGVKQGQNETEIETYSALDKTGLEALVSGWIDRFDAILVKGSRSAAMEEVVQMIKEAVVQREALTHREEA